VLEPPDGENETCRVRFKDARLPDVGKIRKQIAAMGVGASLRGVEIALEGELAAGARLQVAGADGTIRLLPLRENLRWDAKAARPRKLTSAERDACHRAQKQPVGSRLRVIGSLVQENEGAPGALQIRWFERLEPAAPQ
jgi:hypothetical protein